MEAQIHGEAYARQKVKERRNNAIAQSKNSTDINKPIEYEKLSLLSQKAEPNYILKLKLVIL